MSEKAIFGMDYLRVTTGYNQENHQGSYALNFAGKDTGIDSFYAPFTGTVKRIRSTANELWFESNEPVQWANGTVDYVTMLLVHANSVSVSVGDVVKQGALLYTEGTSGNYVTGNHIHCECGKGKFVSPYGWYNTGVTLSSGETIWNLYNQVPVNDVLFVKPTCTIMNAGTNGFTGAALTWKTYSADTVVALAANSFFKVTVNNMQCFNSRDVNDVASVDNGYLTNGTIYMAYNKVVGSDYTWYQFRHPTDGKLYWSAMISGRYSEYTPSYTELTNKMVKILSQTQSYDVIDPFSTNDTVAVGTFVTTSKITVDKIYGYNWYACSIGGSTVYISADSATSLVDGSNNLIDCATNTLITITSSHTQFFNSMNVDDVASSSNHATGFLVVGESYYASKETTTDVGGYKWYVITVDGSEYYLAYIASYMTVGTGTGSENTGGSTGTDGGSTTPTVPSGNYTTNVLGIDVSKYQYTINWASVKGDSQNIKFAFMRCVSSNSSGLYVDGTFFTNMAGAKAQGIYRGSYIFTYAVTNAAIDAELALALPQFSGLGMEYPVAWDMEANKFYTNGSTSSEIKSNNTALALYALNKIKSAGYYPVFYTFTSFLNGYVYPSQIESAGYKIWVADYRGYNGYKGTTAIWQYSSSGSVSGISGRTDMDRCYWDFNAFIKAGNWNGYTGGSGTGETNSSTSINGYAYTAMTGKAILNANSHSQYFGSPSVNDETNGYLTIDTKYTIVGQLTTQYDGYTWYVCNVGGSSMFVPYLSDRMSIVDITSEAYTVPYTHTVLDPMQNFEVIATSEKFNTPNVSDTAGYLTKDRVYSLYAILDSQYDYNGYHFGVVIIDSKPVYVYMGTNARVYSGTPYQRTALDTSKYAVATDATSSYYAIPTTYDNTAAGTLTQNTMYQITTKMNYQYQGLDWYSILVGENTYYVPDTSTIDIRLPEYTSTAWDSYIVYQTVNAVKGYAMPSTSSSYVDISSGTKFSTGSTLNDQYESSSWIKVTYNDSTVYIKIDANITSKYEYAISSVESYYYATPLDGKTFLYYDHASTSATSHILSGSTQVTGKVNDTIENHTWYTIVIDNTVYYIWNDSSNGTMEYKYDTESLPDGIYFYINISTFKVYARPSTSSTETTVASGAYLHATKKVTSQLTGTWYQLEDATYLNASSTGCELVHKYTETAVDSHTILTVTSISGISAYLYAQTDSTTAAFPNATTVYVKATLTANGKDWYRIEKDGATYYILKELEHTSYTVTMVYAITAVTEGTYLQPNVDGVKAYLYTDTTTDAFTMVTGQKYKVTGTIEETINNATWYVVLVDSSLRYIPKGSTAYDVFLWYASHILDGDYLFGSSNSINCYDNPIDKTISYVTPAGKYVIVSKLNDQYFNTDWYIIHIDDMNKDYYVEYSSGNTSVFLRVPGSDGALAKQISDVSTIITEVNSEIAKLSSESSGTVNALIEVYKRRMQSLEIRLEAAQKRIDDLTVGVDVINTVTNPENL